MDGHVDAEPWRAALIGLLVRTSRVQSLRVRSSRAEVALLLRPVVRPVAAPGWPEPLDDRIWLTARQVGRVRVVRHRPADAVLGREGATTPAATGGLPPIGLAFRSDRPGSARAELLDDDLEMVDRLATVAGLLGATRWCALDRPGERSTSVGERDELDLVLPDGVLDRRLELTVAWGRPTTLLDVDVAFGGLAISSAHAEPVDLDATLIRVARAVTSVPTA